MFLWFVLSSICTVDATVKVAVDISFMKITNDCGKCHKVYGISFNNKRMIFTFHIHFACKTTADIAP